MIPLFSYCCKKPICNVSMIFHIPGIHCLCDGWRRILISTRGILRSDTNTFAKIDNSLMQHKVMVHVDIQILKLIPKTLRPLHLSETLKTQPSLSTSLSPMGMYLSAVPNKYLPT